MLSKNLPLSMTLASASFNPELIKTNATIFIIIKKKKSFE